MQSVIKKNSISTKENNQTQLPKPPNLKPLEEVRDPKPVEVGACWCPGIGQEVVTGTTFPILLGRC